MLKPRKVRFSLLQIYPLLFRPLFKERVWGGQRLRQFFPHLPTGRVGEAWVLSDHPQGPTPVENGPYAGRTLSWFRELEPAAVFGTRGLSAKTDQFPLLFKLLDSQEDLSIQVHPGDDYEGLPPGELGKTEMWVVLAAEPGARVVYGLAEGTTAERFAEAVRTGRTMDVMRQVEARAGDVFYVPSGTVHALGTGLMVAEIQQSSDTTYRIYDYDRPGLDGKPRELHVEHALRVSSYVDPPPQGRAEVTRSNEWLEICRSPYFVVSLGQCTGTWEQRTTPESFQALMLLEGEGALQWEGGEVGLERGSTVLVPSALGSYRLAGRCRSLMVRIP